MKLEWKPIQIPKDFIDYWEFQKKLRAFPALPSGLLEPNEHDTIRGQEKLLTRHHMILIAEIRGGP